MSAHLTDGPECDTCGKTTCPDAQLAAFSEPVECEFGPIYHALRDARNCDYGCARDYTNQSVRLEVVGAVESIVAARVAEARADERRRVAERIAEKLRKHAAKYGLATYRQAWITADDAASGARAEAEGGEQS